LPWPHYPRKADRDGRLSASGLGIEHRLQLDEVDHHLLAQSLSLSVAVSPCARNCSQ